MTSTKKNSLFVNQYALTGESFPAEKTPSPVKVKDPSITEWSNYLFMGNIHRERHSHDAGMDKNKQGNSSSVWQC